MEKYFNDAIIGNTKIVASYTKKGELLRLYYQNRDYKQIIDFFNTVFSVRLLSFFNSILLNTTRHLS